MATIIISGVILAVVILTVIKIIRDKKSGKTSCGCNCQGCAIRGSCHKRDGG